MNREEISFWNGVHKGLILAQKAVGEVKGRDNLAAAQAIREKIDQVENLQSSYLAAALESVK